MDEKTTEKPKTVWEVLSRVDCSKYIKTLKQGNTELKYLSWSWAWGILIENYPDATYEVREWEGFPYLFDGNLGYLVETSITIEGKTLSMRLPTMDGANKAQKNVPWSYKVNEYVQGRRTGKMIDKFVEPATMFDINTTIMRCLVKNIALFGLGHYIYAGEDLPIQDEQTPPPAPPKTNGAAPKNNAPKITWTPEQRAAKIKELIDLGANIEIFVTQICHKKTVDEVTDEQIQKGIDKKKSNSKK